MEINSEYVSPSMVFEDKKPNPWVDKNGSRIYSGVPLSHTMKKTKKSATVKEQVPVETYHETYY